MNIENHTIKLLSFITISFLFLSQNTFSQSVAWMPKWDIDFLKDAHITYTQPNGFDEVIQGGDCFENNPKLKKILRCGGNQLRSKDSCFVIFNMLGTTYTRFPENDQIGEVLPGKGKTPYTPETNYIFYIRNDIRQSLGDKEFIWEHPINWEKYVKWENELQWEKYVQFYSKKEAKRKFNATIALSYSIHLESKDYYKGKYNNLFVLLIQKKDKPWDFLRMYCFYKDMPQNKLAQYKAQVEGIFRYKD